MANKMIIGAAAGALSLFALTGAASAASVTFDSFVSNDSDPLGATVTVTDNMDGTFGVSLDLADSDEGTLTGFYLGTNKGLLCTDVSVAAGAPSYTGCYDNPTDIPNNANLNGLISDYGVFDFALSYPIGGNDESILVDETDLPLTLFNVSSDGLTLDHFTSVGLRFQDSNAPGGSEKLFSDTVAPIPVPAAGFMLLAGLGGLAAARRRKN